MIISHIIIHSDIVNEFKQKALQAYPNECISAILGKQIMETLYIYALDDLSITNSSPVSIFYDRAEEEIEAGSNLKYFGTIHSHPNALLTFSKYDKQDFLELQYKDSNEKYLKESLEDVIMGIMTVNDKKKVIEWGLIFFNSAMTQIETLISETKNGRL